MKPNFDKQILDKINLKVFKSGIKKNKEDLLLITLPKDSSISGVFTKSISASSAVNLCKENLKFKPKRVRAILVNSGNSNTFTGKQGEKCVETILSYLKKKLYCSKKEIYTASTGVIGEFLDPYLIINALEKDVPTYTNSWSEAAKSIMTTDTFHKLVYERCNIDNEQINIIGIAKGSGMIAPNMATMLSFIFTDANISSNVLQKILTNENQKTFNSITVDSDTSTSDTVLLASTNTKINKKITDFNDLSLNNFKKSIHNLMLNLAKQIVIDGEGAKKLIHIKITNAISFKSAKKIGLSIANSPLVKTAFAGEDANWGRIIMAIGKCYEKIDIKKIKLYFGKQLVTLNGMKYPKYSEQKATEYLKNSQIDVTIDLGIGNKSWSIYTCDLTKEYIEINADYRS